MALHNPSQGSPGQIVRITGTGLEDNCTVYVICITLDKYCWTVRHRYSHFDELNSQLTQYCKLEKSLLPPKKIFGNQTDAFVQRRKIELEVYLQTVLRLLPKVPPPLAAFLGFSIFEIHGILKSLAKELFLRGDGILSAKEFFLFSPLHLNALSERLLLPEPPCDSADKSQDLSHILDFFSQLERALVVGSPLPIGTSNIVPNQLSFDFLRFRSLRHLQLEGCNSSMISGAETVRKTVEILEIHRSISSLKEFLLCDVVHYDQETNPILRWTQLRKSDFSHNNIAAIDESVGLLWQTEELNLSRNHLSEIRFLELLPSLRLLDVSSNRFVELDSLHTRLGNVVSLNLSNNGVERLKGFARLYSLVSLDLSSNRVEAVSEVVHLAGLPCLENISFVANPITNAIDYRTRVLELFDKRAAEICLDNEGATSKEMDTVAIRLALRRARLSMTTQNSRPTNPPTPLQQADSTSTNSTSSSILDDKEHNHSNTTGQHDLDIPNRNGSL